jgi:Mce-associated membrane protein
VTDDSRDTETLEDATEVEDAEPERRRRRLLRGIRLVPVLLVLLLLISGGAATWIYFKQYRPDEQTAPSVVETVAKAASDGTIALMSYTPETLDRDFASARSHLSGGFLDYYNHFTEQIIAPAARQKSLKTSAHVKGAAVSKLQPDSALVLVLVDQTTTSKDNPEPSTAASSVLVSMVRVNSQWLITKFEPV